MSSGSAKVVVQVESTAEQEEHQKTSRKLLKDVQNVSTMDKENILKPNKMSAYIVHKELAKKTVIPELLEGVELKRKKIVQSQSVQTSPQKASSSKPTITVEDLTSLEGPSQQYWEVLAEKRRLALEESLTENRELYEKLAVLEQELDHSKQMLEEARNLVEVLTELLQEAEAEKEESASNKQVGDANRVEDSGLPHEEEVDCDSEDGL